MKATASTAWYSTQSCCSSPCSTIDSWQQFRSDYGIWINIMRMSLYNLLFMLISIFSRWSCRPAQSEFPVTLLIFYTLSWRYLRSLCFWFTLLLIFQDFCVVCVSTYAVNVLLFFTRCAIIEKDHVIVHLVQVVTSLLPSWCKRRALGSGDKKKDRWKSGFFCAFTG